MLRNYITTLFRNFLRQRKYSLLNLFGLSLGMASCIIIMLFVSNELSFDRQNSKLDRIYRVIQKTKEEKDLAWVGGAMAGMLKEEFTEFEKVASITPATFIVSRQSPKNTVSFREDKAYYTDPELVDIFDFEVLEGTLAAALNDPNELIITEKISKKYFGNENALGKTLKIGKAELVVTAVIGDLPANSHFHPELLISMATFKTQYGFSVNDNFASYWWPFTWTYVLVKDAADINSIHDRMASTIKKHRQEPEASKFIPTLQPLKKIHLYSDLNSEIEASGNIRLVYLFASIAFFILLLACVNFMNLATARALKRSREVGVRKAIGANRRQLIFQFLGESILLSTAALSLSLVIAEISLPFFNSQLNLSLSLPYSSIQLWYIFVLLILFTGILAGSYPAFYLSSFKPAHVLKSNTVSSMGGVDLRKALVVFQFSISTTLIICSTIAYYQIDYLRHAKLGFDKEHILILDLLGANATFDATCERLRQNASVKLVAGSNARPGLDQGWGPFNFETIGITAKDDQRITQQLVSYDFFDILGLELVAGRKFDTNTNTDLGRMYLMRERFPAYEGRNYIINESAARLIGKSPQDALGMPMRIFTEENGQLFSDYKGNVVGVVKDYHSGSLRESIKPTAYLLGNENLYAAILVKLQPGDVFTGVQAIKKIWKETNPDVPLKYSFLEDDIDKLYQSEEKLGVIIGAFSGMVLFVACLGLFGLSAYTAEMKTKEIGIRKILGASTSKIVTMLSKEFIVLLLIALVISIPIGWYISTKWLNEFAYKITISVWYFTLAGLISILIAFITISWQTIKAAMSNPVDSLRSE